jgi:ankyrin repeat protein
VNTSSFDASFQQSNQLEAKKDSSSGSDDGNIRDDYDEQRERTLFKIFANDFSSLDIVDEDDNMTPLMTACCMDDYDFAEVLLLAGASVDFKDSIGATALMFACVSSVRCVELLINYGADANVRDCYGWYPLLHAIDHGSEACVKLLLKYGADVHITNSKGMSALVFAVFHHGSLAAIDYLLGHGAAVDDKDDDGMTALMYAVNDSMHEVIALLLFYGADISLANNDGQTVVDFIRSKDVYTWQLFMPKLLKIVPRLTVKG